MCPSEGLGTPKTPCLRSLGQEKQTRLKVVQVFQAVGECCDPGWGMGGGFARTCPALLWVQQQESQAENFLGA